MKKEILQEVLKVLKDKGDFTSKYPNYNYICLIIGSSQFLYKFGEENCEEVKSWFKKQRPGNLRHPEFYNHSAFTGDYSWWDGEEVEQRVLFIKKLLKDL